MDKTRLVVIGNGMAGLRFLEELEACGAGEFSVTVIGAEPEPAYNRILLSSVLAEEASKQDIAFKSRDWYRQNDFELLTGVFATKIEPGEKTVSLANGETISYDKLVIATGSQPIVIPFPGHDLKNVLTFRNLHDVEQLQAVEKGKKAIVIGGGLLGLETAYGLQKMGVDVTVVHLMDRLMERQLDAEAANILKEKIEEQGIQVLLEANTECLLGDESVTGLRLKDGREFPADLVIMAVGIRPDTAIGEQAGLKINRGILVDDRLATSDPNIYALGECAEHNGIAYGLVEPLYQQASVLAKSLTGDAGAAYSGSSISTNLKVSGIEIFSAGEFETAEDAEIIYFRDPALGIYKKLQIRRGPDGLERLVGAVLVGDRVDGPWYAELIANETPIDKMREILMFGRDLAENAA